MCILYLEFYHLFTFFLLSNMMSRTANKRQCNMHYGGSDVTQLSVQFQLKNNGRFMLKLLLN